MGLFSRIKNFGKTIARGFGKALEKIGDVTNNLKLEVAGLNIQINNEPEFDKVDLNGDSSIDDTINVHKKCEDIRIQVAKQAEKIETQIVNQIYDDIKKYNDALREILPANVINELNLEMNGNFENEIRDCVSGYVSSMISQDSDEFVNLLKYDDDKRDVAIKNYTAKVLNDAKELLINTCTEQKIKIYKNMYCSLENYLNDQKNIVECLENNYKELTKYENDIDYKKTKAIKVIKNVACAQCVKSLTFDD